MWFVYILKCADNSLYVGSTTNLERRLSEHNEGKGGAYTRARLPVKRVYEQALTNRSEAQKRESEIKSWRRHKKLELIT